MADDSAKAPPAPRKRPKARTAIGAGLLAGSAGLFTWGLLPEAGPPASAAGPPEPMERSAGAALAPKRHGRCLTTLIAIHMGMHGDPGVTIPTELVLNWLRLCQHDPKVRMRARRLWPRARVVLPA